MAQLSEELDHVKTKLKLRLAEMLQSVAVDHDKPLSREEIQGHLRQVWDHLSRDTRRLHLTPAEQERLFTEILDEVVGLGPIEPFLHDETVSEVMVNGPHEIFVERDGRLERVPARFNDAPQLMMVIERLLGSVGLSVNEASPLCDASLPDGSRVNVIIPPLVLNGPTVTIRRHVRRWTIEDYLRIDSLSEPMAEFLEACVKARVNLLVSGGTSTGKTSLVALLSRFIPPAERVITIENIPELHLVNREHWVRLVSRSGNLEGQGEIPLRTLVRNALRMRPDRIILGEARGGEALDVVQAMHLGHDGFITVMHANAPKAALERLQMLMLMSGLEVPPSTCQMQIASAVDLVIHMGRLTDGSRRVERVSQMLGTSAEGFAVEDLFRFEVAAFDPDGKVHGAFQYTGIRPKFLGKFRMRNVKVPAWLDASA